MRRIGVLMLMLAGVVGAQDAGAWKGLEFLRGTWAAKASGGSAGATASGAYTFALELQGHILARHSSGAGCKGPADFNCEHGDLLYLYRDAPGQAPQAIYFDNEGHVIHYEVSMPAPNRVVFLTNAATPGPRFRLTYELKGGVMSGKFESLMPGQSEWKAYLEWSGGKMQDAK